MVCQGLVFTAVYIGSIVWRRSPNGLWRMGTLGTRTWDLEESLVADMHLFSLGFTFFSGLLHMLACPSVVALMLDIIDSIYNQVFNT